MRSIQNLRWELLRLWFIGRVRLGALSRRASVDLHVARDARVASSARVSFDPGSENRLVLAAGAMIHEDVLILLRGGTVELGRGASIRRGTVVNVSGRLELMGRNIISYYNVIHCNEHVRLDELASTNEFCTIVDSRHFHDGEHEFFYENVESAPISIGRNVWLANKSSILMGVTIGDEAIIGGHSVVNKDVPAKAFAAGSPAKVVRQR